MDGSETGNGEYNEKAVRTNTTVVIHIVIIVSLILAVGIPVILGFILYKKRKMDQGTIYVYLKHKNNQRDTKNKILLLFGETPP